MSSIFISSQGSNIYTTIGALEGFKDDIKKITYWNCAGNSSLIVFFKCLGYTFKQMFKIFSELQLLNNTINGSNIIPYDEEELKIFIYNWLRDKLKENQIFKENSTLKEVYNLTKIFPAFILWHRTEEGKIINANPNTLPDIKLIDAVMASLCSIGTYKEYKIDNYTFSNVFSIDSYPYIHCFYPDKNEFIYLANIYETKKNNKNNNLGPLQDIEDEIIYQFCENINYRINNISKTFEKDEDSKFIKLYSQIKRGDSSREELKMLFVHGLNQTNAYLEGKDTKTEYMMFLMKEVYSQS